MSGEYRRNHYVPVWYQRRFIPATAASHELLYLNLNPGSLTDAHGVVHQRKSLRRLGPKHCFFETDLYATTLPTVDSTEIERFFFGGIDADGRNAVDHFGEFEHMKPGQHEARYARSLASLPCVNNGLIKTSLTASPSVRFPLTARRLVRWRFISRVGFFLQFSRRCQVIRDCSPFLPVGIFAGLNQLVQPSRFTTAPQVREKDSIFRLPLLSAHELENLEENFTVSALWGLCNCLSCDLF
jgi:hypothetical protein